MKKLELKDIKPIVDINDNSLYILIGLIIAILLVVGVISYFLYRKYVIKQRRYRKTKEYKAKEALKNIDFNDTKKAVYDFSKYSQVLAEAKNINELNNILKELEKYKFKKDVEPLNSIDIKRMKKFIKEVS